ncbi:MAG: hypothetical protein IK093_14435 [Ruminiclostridium sp.]|nr:hypothetical protein [Ruminiclostridium sp.]
MRKTKHRITSFFLAVCMAVTCAAGMSIPAAAATDNTKKVLWDTGVAAVGDFVPHGRILAPLLNEFGKLLGIGANDGPSIGDVSKQISQLSNDIKDFREHMDKELQDLKKTMSAEIRTALDDVKTKIFMQGVGTGLDALHTQISKPGTGIADQIDSFNEGNLTEQEKMIEMASLIGCNDQWGNTSMPMATFRNMGTLLSGNPYSDEEGRNMYQVLYDNAAKKTMFTGEAYDMIAPYIDRVMLEYFYDYAIVMQCLNASLYVSQITETQAKELPMAYQAKYSACFTPTATVKKAIDAITEEFLDANDPKSMISMYMVFKYKQQYDRNVYINKGTTEQAYSTTLDTYVPQLVGDKCIANRVKWFSEDQELKLLSGEFEEHMKGNLSRDDIKAINEHVKNTNPGKSFYDYLSSFGFNTNYYKNNEKAYFPVGGPTLQALSNEEARLSRQKPGEFFFRPGYKTR